MPARTEDYKINTVKQHDAAEELSITLDQESFSAEHSVEDNGDAIRLEWI